MGFTKKQRQDVHAKLDGHCGYCGKEITIKEMQVDHMMPRCLHQLSGNHIDNLMPACRRCNHYKRANTVEGYRWLLKGLHKRLSTIYIVNVAVDFGMMEIKPFDGVFYFENELAKKEDLHK